MGNCSASKLGGGEEEPVSLCRERKRLLKVSVKRRQALAEAHGRYIHSIRAVAGAINLFVARHSSHFPVLVTLPSSSPPSSTFNPSFLRQTPTEPKTDALTYRSSVSSSTSSSATSNLREEREGEEYFFAEMPMAPPSETEVYGWDFFNPFEGLTAAVMNVGINRSSDEDLRVVREQEGIPELEEGVMHEAKKEVAPMTVAMEVKEKGDMVVKIVESEDAKGGEMKESELTIMEITQGKMELLDALKDVEEEFLKAYDSGKELARMLGADIIDIHTDDEIKDNSSKFIQAITWHRSSSSLSSSSRKSLVCKNTSLTEARSEIFEDYGGMGSGSHCLTLGRLYAWEKKLYEEVKAGEQTRQMYQKKCLQLRNVDAKGSGSHTSDKSRAAVKDLYARIWVSLRTIETISIRIQKVRDDELHPQLIELLQGLMRTWESMLQSHERQKQIMSSINAFTTPSYGRYCSDSQRQVTKKLEEQLENWRSSFKNYVSAQRSYVEALDGWHSKFSVPDYSRTRYSASSSYREGSPPLLSILREWLSSSMKLPDRDVSLSMKGLINNMRVVLVKQGEEQQRKRKVDNLAKEFDQRITSLQKTENRALEFKLSDAKHEPVVHDRAESLAERKNLVDMLRQKLELEKAKHRKCMQETTEATFNGFKFGLGHVFESLTDFSRDSLKLYAELLARNERAKLADDSVTEKASCIKDSKVEADIR